MTSHTDQPPVALVTGVSRATGLGLETARQLGRKGFTVLVTARDRGKKVEALAGGSRAEGIDAHAAVLDIHDDASVVARRPPDLPRLRPRPWAAAHESPRTTKLHDRTSDEITLDEIDRILI